MRAVPVVDVPANLILLNAIAFLDLALQLIAPAVDDIKVVVGKFAPLLSYRLLEPRPVCSEDKEEV